jgi:hypothetical protein
MIRKNPGADLPLMHPDAFVDSIAILCGKVVGEITSFANVQTSF